MMIRDWSDFVTRFLASARSRRLTTRLDGHTRRLYVRYASPANRRLPWGGYLSHRRDTVMSADRIWTRREHDKSSITTCESYGKNPWVARCSRCRQHRQPSSSLAPRRPSFTSRGRRGSASPARSGSRLLSTETRAGHSCASMCRRTRRTTWMRDSASSDISPSALIRRRCLILTRSASLPTMWRWRR